MMAIFKAKVKLDRARLEASFNKKINRVLSDSALLDEVGDFVVERVRFEARRQRPLNSSRSFPDLKDSSIRIRDRLSDFNATTRTYNKNRSNVSFTGQLLDSLTYNVVSSRRVIVIFFKGLRFPYFGPKGLIKLDSKSKSNEGVAQQLFERGFVVFDNKGLGDETFRRRIKNIIRKYIRKNLR